MIKPFAFNKCVELICVTFPRNLVSIEPNAFLGCSKLCGIVLLQHLIFIDIAPNAFGDCSNLRTLIVSPYFHLAEDRWAETFPFITRAWAPDDVIARLGGALAPFNRQSTLPIKHQARPGAVSWAGVQLWERWSAPTAAHRVPSPARRRIVWWMLLINERFYKTTGGPQALPIEMWCIILSFLQHDAAPTLTCTSV
jgi:hypothetical protein